MDAAVSSLLGFGIGLDSCSYFGLFVVNPIFKLCRGVFQPSFDVCVEEILIDVIELLVRAVEET